jgi:exonuclease SbcD
MKIIHLSDLHLGKRLNEYSLIDDQKYILIKIKNVIDEEKPDLVVIAGDIYDKSVPSAEAVELFDDFLVSLAQRKLQVCVISGNHDSPERLAFGNRLMDKSGIHISPVYNGKTEPLLFRDSYGEIFVYMLPFIKPANVRRFFEDEEINTYTDAMRVAISAMNIDESKRNILVTHQFVTGAERSESEEINVGGSDNIDASVFEVFDYIALGHIHGPQNIGSERIRYCGTPLKYSFSEVKHQKSVTVVELKEKGILDVKTVPLTPRCDLVEIKGKYNDLMSASFYEGTTYREDYMRVILTDEDDIIDAISKLRVVYKNIMSLDYDNKRTRSKSAVTGSADIENKTPLQLFSDFFEIQNGSQMTDEQTEYVSDLINKIWEEEQ